MTFVEVRVGWAVLVAGGCVAGVGASGCAPPIRADASGVPPQADAAAGSQDAGGTQNPDGGEAFTAPVTTGTRIDPQVPPYAIDACATRTRDGWCWVTPRPQGSALADLSSPRSGEMWAVGAGGTVLHGVVNPLASADWALVDVGVASDLTAVSEAADGTVFIGSNAGDVVRGDASGGWTMLPAPGLARITGLWGASRDEAWAAGNEATIYHWTGPGGWRAADVGPDAVTAVVGRAANDVWMASEIGRSVHWDGAAFTIGDIAIQQRSDFYTAKHDLYFSRMGLLDDGTLWAAAKSATGDGDGWALSDGAWSSANAYTMAGASLADHWAGGIQGNAIHVSPLGPDYIDDTFIGYGLVLAGHENDRWAIAGPGARHGAYGDWDPVTTFFQQTAYVHAAPSGDVWLTGIGTQDESALAARWDGAHWSLFPMLNVASPPTVTSNGSDVWLASTSLWHWNGGALQELPFPTSPPFPSAGWYATSLVATPDAVWLLGDRAPAGSPALLRYDGRSWRVVPLPAGYTPDGDGSALRGTSDGDLWLITRLTVYHYDGLAWSAPTVWPGSGQYGIRDIWPLAPDDVWAGPFHFDGTSWTATAAPDSLGEIYGTWAGSDTEVFTLTSTGLYRWDGWIWSDPLPLPTNGYWYQISATNAGDLWIGGYSGIAHGAPPWPPVYP